MRRIADIDDAGEADRFSDVLLARGIRSEVRRDDGSAELWVHDDARIGEAKELLVAFRADPKAFREHVTQGADRRRAAARDEAAWRDRLRVAQRSMYGADGRGWATLSVIVAAFIVAAASNFGADVGRLGPLFLTTHPAGAGLPELAQGQVWRLVTPVFVHFGLFHLAGNGLMWWSLGARIEQRKGLGLFLALVLFTAVGSNLAQHGWNLVRSPGTVSLVGGLSGVLYGLFGYAWIKGRIDPLDELEVPEQTWMYMIGWLILCMTGAVGPVANAAHVGGLALGAVAAAIDVAWFRWRKRR